MNYILTTVKLKTTELDLKIPSDISVGSLISILGDALNFIPTENLKIQAEPLGRILNNALTLKEQGVLNGAILTVI